MNSNVPNEQILDKKKNWYLDIIKNLVEQQNYHSLEDMVHVIIVKASEYGKDTKMHGS